MNLSLRFILFPSCFSLFFHGIRHRKFRLPWRLRPQKHLQEQLSAVLQLCSRGLGRWHRASPGAPELLQEALDLGADPEALAVASRCP